MTAIATTIAKENSCPDVVVNNTTTYPTNSTHSITNFTEYVKFSLQLPNDFLVTYSQGFPNQVLPPAESLQMILETCLTGKFSAAYKALPTPPETPVVGQGVLYDVGDNFYYDGVIYRILTPNFVNIPVDGFTNEALVAGYLAGNAIEVIEETEIEDKYKSNIEFTHWCQLDKCLLDKLDKINCLIVKEPTRNDLCEMELYEEVIQLNYAKYVVDNELVTPYSSSAEEDYKIKSISNYVNSICCCGKKCDC